MNIFDWIQVILWFPRWIGIGDRGPFPASRPWRGYVYSHRYAIGFLEIRVWTSAARCAIIAIRAEPKYRRRIRKIPGIQKRRPSR